MTHFDEIVCLAYLEGQMDTVRSRELEAHVAGCASCRTLLNALKTETTLLSSALTEDTEPLPARLLSERARPIPSWVWTLAFGVFAAGAYFLWTDGISPWLDQLASAGFGGTDILSTVVFNGAFWEGWSDMIDAIQIGALIVAAAGALVWIRRRMRRPVAVAVVIAAALLALVLPQGASAADVRRGRAVTIPAGETVHNDLVVMGPSVRIDGTVEGDVIAFTRNLDVTGHVTGDVIAFAGDCLIDGTVDGNVRIFTRTGILQGSVAKNLTAFAASLDLAPKSSVGGGAIVLASSADLDGKIARDLLGMIGNTDLEGSIGGQVWLRGGNFNVASTGEIGGPATFEGREQPVVQPGAKLASPIHTEITMERRRNRGSTLRVAIRAIFGYVGAVIVGILLLAVFPGFFRAALRETGSIGLPIGVGALALVAGVFLVAFGILLLFIGIGAGVAGVLGYVPILYLAQVFVGTWIGNRIMGVVNAPTTAVVGRMAVGLLILHVARLIPVLGALVALVVFMWGTGAVLMAFYRMSRVETAPVTAVA